MPLLTSLKEREKRALERFLRKRQAHDEIGDESGVAAASTQLAADAVVTAHCSEGEEEGNDRPLGPPAVRGGAWPGNVTYANDYAWDADIEPALLKLYRPLAPRPRPARPCPRTYAAVIDDPDHPAHGEYGLFAAAFLANGSWVLDYVGAVGLGEREDRTSDYVADFGEQSELALDARHHGNEARFVNDFRNTGRRANVEFKLRRDGRGELRQGLFVCAREGIQPSEELLISYGRSFWRSRVSGSMEDFIYRRPGDPPVARRLPREASEALADVS